jgi:hypothetical protein
MTLPPRLEQLPSEDDVIAALTRLMTKGVRTYWILEPEGWVLLGLDCVRAYLEAPGDDGDEERPFALALRAYLEDAVQRVPSRPHRTILEVVLGLGDERWKSKAWRHEKAKVRRKKAGELFRGPDDDDDVKSDTIRQHHGPRAIKALAGIVCDDEALVRSGPAAPTA